ncbi:MAG: extracellular solute-binding protein [Halovenus sp.]
MADGTPGRGRRSVLTALAIGLSGTAGCSRVIDETDGRPETVSMLAAGSLYNALENGLRPDLDHPAEIEAHGSAKAARLVADEQKDPDIISVADTALFDSQLTPEWYTEFATNELVVIVNPETEGGRRLADAGTNEWYRTLRARGIALGRTDPDFDPLGYRTLFMLELATEHYGLQADLRDQIIDRDQIYPETQLVSQFETGAIDAAIAYRNMAVERGYDYIELPPEINFGTPEFTERYESVAYELPSGVVVEGGLISYASTVRHLSQVSIEVFDSHTDGSYLTEFGFGVPEDYPRETGHVPETVRS